MGFANTVIGGAAALIRAAIKSPNYVTGISGWSINKDGSAEFNSLTIRGTFNGTNFVISASGAFFYDGAPAAGNMILAIAPAAGSDSFGNAYVKGLQVGRSGASSQIRFLSGNVGQASEVLFHDPTGSLSNEPNLAAGLGGTPSNLLVSGPALNITGHKDWVQLFLDSSDGLTADATGSLVYIDTLGNVTQVVAWGSGPVVIRKDVTIQTQNLNLGDGTNAKINLSPVMASPVNWPTAGKTLAQTQACLDAFVQSFKNRGMVNP